MEYIYTGLVSLAVVVLGFIIKSLLQENSRLKKEKEAVQAKKEKALENGVVCLLRVKLIEYHAKYMESGEISSHGYENWNLMYKAYSDLGGNGMILHMKEDIEGLHIK